MRKLLAVALLAAIAAPASAATLGLRFVGGSDETNAVVAQGGTITVEVTWTTTSVDDASKGLTAMAFNLTAAPESPAGGLQGDLVGDADLFGGNNTSALGWNATGAPGPIGLYQYAVNTAPANASYAAGEVVIGTFDITVDAGAALGLHQFYIQRNPASFSPDPVNDAAGSYAFNPSGDGYNGQFNIGNGFAGTNTGANAIPMNIDVVVPEPAALALLALGGIAVLRRRS